MTNEPIKFEDGVAYERMMGVWTQLVGSKFLEWLSPEKDKSWIDVGCGNGAFTEQIVQRCSLLPRCRGSTRRRLRFLLQLTGKGHG